MRGQLTHVKTETVVAESELNQVRRCQEQSVGTEPIMRGYEQRERRSRIRGNLRENHLDIFGTHERHVAGNDKDGFPTGIFQPISSKVDGTGFTLFG